MGLFSRENKTCSICSKGINPVANNYRTLDKKTVCVDCIELLGYPNIPSTKKRISKISSDIIKKKFEALNDVSFTPTAKPSTLAYFDDNNELLKANFSPNGGIPNELISYNKLIDFSIYEDGDTTLSSGLGTALAGGILFGVGGAIVGAIVGKGKVKKNHISSLFLSISTKDGNINKIYFINKKIPIDSSEYRSIKNSFEATVSKLDSIIRKNNSIKVKIPATQLSQADEIRKYKQLFDDGIITQAEYGAKKQELLNL